MINSLTLLQAKLPFQAQFALSGLTVVSDETVSRLSLREKEELNSFTNSKRQNEYLTSRLELRDLARQSEITDRDFSIHKDKYGCPYGMSNAEHYFVSIAHTDEKVFCALSADAEIGIDLEPIYRNVPKKLRQRIIHPDEENEIQRMEPIRLWTIKEAYIKLRGRGLRLNMDEVAVCREEEYFKVEGQSNTAAQIYSFQAANHWLAVAHYQ